MCGWTHHHVGGVQELPESLGEDFAPQDEGPHLRTKHRRDESLYLDWEPITGGKRVYSGTGNQSQKAREYITGLGTNHGRQDNVYTTGSHQVFIGLDFRIKYMYLDQGSLGGMKQNAFAPEIPI